MPKKVSITNYIQIWLKGHKVYATNGTWVSQVRIWNNDAIVDHKATKT